MSAESFNALVNFLVTNCWIYFELLKLMIINYYLKLSSLPAAIYITVIYISLLQLIISFE